VCVVDYPASSIRFVVFHKVVRRHCSGEVSEFLIYDVKFPHDSVHFLPSYSKYKKRDVV